MSFNSASEETWYQGEKKLSNTKAIFNDYHEWRIIFKNLDGWLQTVYCNLTQNCCSTGIITLESKLHEQPELYGYRWQRLEQNIMHGFQISSKISIVNNHQVTCGINYISSLEIIVQVAKPVKQYGEKRKIRS